MIAYDSGFPDFPHVVLSRLPEGESLIDARIHSECMTGDVFGSRRCDCGEQLKASMAHFEAHGGVLIYLRQEGRGIGLIEKMKAYNLQDQGLDTIEANLALGHHSDARDFNPAIEILQDLGIDRIRLLTNNPEKVKVFEGSPVEVVERLPISIAPNSDSAPYLETKRTGMGHFLNAIKAV